MQNASQLGCPSTCDALPDMSCYLKLVIECVIQVYEHVIEFLVPKPPHRAGWAQATHGAVKKAPLALGFE
jgi:hypothetical protein